MGAGARDFRIKEPPPTIFPTEHQSKTAWPRRSAEDSETGKWTWSSKDRLRFGSAKSNKFVLLFSHLALSFDKIGYGSGKKIEQALFFPLTLHYLCAIIHNDIILVMRY